MYADNTPLLSIQIEMNGILVISFQSGMLLYSQLISPNFGFLVSDKVEELDPMQLSSSIFAFYKITETKLKGSVSINPLEIKLSAHGSESSLIIKVMCEISPVLKYKVTFVNFIVVGICYHNKGSFPSSNSD